MFEKWKSIPRLNKEVIVTEKIDGTNAQIHIVDKKLAQFEVLDWNELYHSVLVERTLAEKDGLLMFAGSRSRYLTIDNDNFGFAKWVSDNADDLFRLGPGRHYGEWWGLGIQRGYGLSERRLSMFNPKWEGEGPVCVTSAPIVPVESLSLSGAAEEAMCYLKRRGSIAAPGFMDPEGIVVYHTAANQMFKQTFDFDEGKWSST